MVIFDKKLKEENQLFENLIITSKLIDWRIEIDKSRDERTIEIRLIKGIRGIYFNINLDRNVLFIARNCLLNKIGHIYICNEYMSTIDFTVKEIILEAYKWL